MSLFRQLFFIEGRLLAEAPRDRVFVHADLQPPESMLFYCGVCGEVYARLPVMTPMGQTTEWQSYKRLCRKCHAHESLSRGLIPGSVWLGWDGDFLAALPVPVLQWECERHLETFDRWSQS